MIRWLLIVLLMLVPLSTGASPNVIGLNLPYRLSPIHDLHYNQMLKHMQALGFTHQLTVLPFSRSFVTFANQDEACVFPSTIQSFQTAVPAVRNTAMIESNPVDVVSMRIFTRAGEPVISDINQLSGKAVAYANGIKTDLILGNLPVELHQTEDEGIRLKMLYGNRVDAILGFSPDVRLAALSLGFPIPESEPSLKLLGQDSAGVRLVCKATESGYAAIDSFNDALAQMQQDGSLESVLGPLIDLSPWQ